VKLTALQNKFKANNMKRSFAIILTAIIIILDQVTKAFVLSGVAEPIYLTSFFNIVQVWNEGIAFGLFSSSGGNLVFMFITGMISLVFVYLLFKEKALARNISMTYAAILGGAVGNFIDRVRYSAVFDFIDLHIADYHWPAFNLADSFICAGTLALIWSLICNKRNNKRNNKKRS
jgi:signal peptidase II